MVGLNRRARLMFQDARLLPWERVAGNVGLGLPRARAARVDWALDRSAWPTAPRTGRRSSPAASSSGSRWPVRWPANPACSCSTNRSGRSTP